MECRYPKSGFVLASVGFMVRTPSLNLPSAQLTAEGRFGVELRIAEGIVPVLFQKGLLVLLVRG